VLLAHLEEAQQCGVQKWSNHTKRCLSYLQIRGISVGC
jgi:hypothetical protein